MSEDEIKQAELRGYSRGYNAGKRRKQRGMTYERLCRERQAFLDRAFIAALTACVTADGWKAGEKPITNIPDRVKLAADFAVEALKKRPTA